MNLLQSLEAMPDDVSTTRIGWFGKLKKQDPETADQVVQIIRAHNAEDPAVRRKLPTRGKLWLFIADAVNERGIKASSHAVSLWAAKEQREGLLKQ